MTRNKDTYRFKGRAIFLAAIMVISVLAMPLAFAGGAAATVENASLTFENQALEDDEVTVFDVEAQNNSGTADGVVVITFNDSTDEIVAGFTNVSDLDGENVQVEIENATGFPGTHTAHLFNQSEFSAGIGDAVSNPGDALVQESAFVGNNANPVGYEEGENFFVGQNVYLENVDGPSSFNLRPWDGERAGTTVRTVSNSSGVAEFSLPSDGDFLLTSGSDRGVSVVTDGAGNFSGFADNVDSQSIEVLDQDLDVSFEEDSVDNEGETNIELEIDSTLRDNYDVEVTVDGFDEDDYEQVFGDTGLSVKSVDDDSIVLRNAEGTQVLNFSEIDEGDYEFDVDVVDSDASASASITVNEGQEGQVTFVDNNVDVQQGDIAEFDLEFESGQDEATFVIGDIEDDGYEAVVNLTNVEDDELTVYINTYLAGLNSTNLSNVDGDNEIVSLDDDADADIELDVDNENQEGIEGILDIGDYTLYLIGGTGQSVEDIVDNADELGALFVNERNIGDMNLWTASSDNLDDVEDVDDVVAAIEAVAVTETEEIAFDDALIHQIEIDGIGGYLAGLDGDEAEEKLTDAIESNKGLELTIEQDDETRQPNRGPKQVNDLSALDLNVIYEGGELFVIIESIDDTDAAWNRAPSDGDAFNVELTITDQRLLEEGDGDAYTPFGDEDEHLTIDALFSVADRDAEFDVTADDVIEVEAAEEQEITGTTNIAPGSEFNVRVTGQGDARFTKTLSDVVVDTDGTFSADFDFSDRSVDEEFTAQIRQGGFDSSDQPSADGLIVEAVEPVEEPEEEPEEEEPEEEPEEPEEEPEDEPEPETEDDTPGFGALVALLAVLGAAFLATRRQN